MAFYSRLSLETRQAQNAFGEVAQIRDGLAGNISLATYIAYLTEAYHHVKHTVPLMRAAGSRLGRTQSRFRDALDDYIAEETGHEAWILNDIRHCGGDAQAAQAGPPRAETMRMVAFAYDYIACENPMGLFGMIYVLEGTSVRLASQGATAVATSLGLGADCFSYLASHGALDQHHLIFFQRLMDEVAEPADQDAIIEVANVVFGLFGDIFRAIPHDRLSLNVL